MFDKVQMFCDTLTAHYSEHHLAPSLIFASIPSRDRADPTPTYYATIHTFPNGLASRQIVTKATSKVSLEEAFDSLVEVWCIATAPVNQEPN